MKKQLTVTFIIFASFSQITFSSAADVTKFFSKIFDATPKPQAGGGAGPGVHVAAQAIATKPPIAPPKKLPFVKHALNVLLNISDVMRNPDGQDSADLVALDVIAASAKRNIEKLSGGQTKDTVQAYNHLFSPHTMPPWACAHIHREIVEGDPFKTHRAAIIAADSDLKDLKATLAIANAAARKTVLKGKKQPIAAAANQAKTADESATLKPFPYLRHAFFVFRKFHAFTQNPKALKTDAEYKELADLINTAGDNFDALAQTAARPTLEAYNHLFSGTKLSPPLKQMVAQELAKGNPFIVHKQLIIACDKAKKGTLTAAAK
jgi:hypothetical protein